MKKKLEKSEEILKKFTKEMVNDYADKLLIGLSEEENKMVLDEMEIIEDTMNKINDIKGISEIEPMVHCLDDFTVDLREDIAKKSSDIEEVLSNCDDYEDREIVVPKVVKNNDIHE